LTDVYSLSDDSLKNVLPLFFNEPLAFDASKTNINCPFENRVYVVGHLKHFKANKSDNMRQVTLVRGLAQLFLVEELFSDYQQVIYLGYIWAKSFVSDVTS
jgi:hypothetical protein